MMGRSHLITGICALEHLYVADRLMAGTDLVFAGIIRHTAASYLGIENRSADIMGLPLFFIPLYLGAYFLGCILPDADSPNSILGRIVHIPFEHRTWMHSIYPYLVIAVLGVAHPVFSWLFFGSFVHLFWDSFSACGNCWFYKILSDYRRYPGNAKVKKGHRLKLYHAGQWSEYLLLFLIITVTVVSFLWIWRI